MKEELLLDGLQKRDKVVFDYVFNCYYSGLCAFSMQYINNKDAVEDLVQDFFVALWILGPKLEINTNLKAYLFSSVKNRSLDYIKHARVKDKYKAFLLSANKHDSIGTEQMFAESELREAIQRSLDKLPPRCREIFILSRTKGLSNTDLSEQLHISKRTVELQISNALRALRLELAEYMPSFLVFWLLA